MLSKQPLFFLSFFLSFFSFLFFLPPHQRAACVGVQLRPSGMRAERWSWNHRREHRTRSRLDRIRARSAVAGVLLADVASSLYLLLVLVCVFIFTLFLVLFLFLLLLFSLRLSLICRLISLYSTESTPPVRLPMRLQDELHDAVFHHPLDRQCDNA